MSYYHSVQMSIQNWFFDISALILHQYQKPNVEKIRRYVFSGISVHRGF